MKLVNGIEEALTAKTNFLTCDKISNTALDLRKCSIRLITDDNQQETTLGSEW